MFGFVSAQWKELTPQQQKRYESVYCGICRQIRLRSSGTARLSLSYDMAFLGLLLMSLYEPEEQTGEGFCALHPLTRKHWTENPYIDYAADMNVALAYYNCLDDWKDDKKLSARVLASAFGKDYPRIRQAFPRQCHAIEDCLNKLSELEKANCPNPDEPAGAFGTLMGELLTYREDIWAPELRKMGFSLGRFIYLMDAAMDYDKDVARGKYNPFAAQGGGKQPQVWEEYLVLAMGRCTDSFEKLPLVQDKEILDNILYSGVWALYRKTQRIQRRERSGD